MRAGAARATEPSKVLLILAFAAIYVLWGSTYLAIRYTVETMPPFLMAGVRAFVAGVILFGFVGVPRMRRLTADHWRSAAITGGLFFLGCHGLLFWTEQHTPSGIAALFLATIPGWMAILSRVAGGAALKARTIVGLLLGLAGAVEQVVAEGNLVVTRFISRGTFDGEPSHGKEITMPEIAIHRIVDGKIVEQWTVADILGMRQQLGTLDIPVDDSASEQ